MRVRLPFFAAILTGAVLLPACRGAEPALTFDAANPVGTYEWNSTGAEGEPLSGTLVVEGEPGALRASLTSSRLPLLELPAVRAEGSRLVLENPEGGEEALRVELSFEGGAFSGHWAMMGAQAPMSGRLVSRTPQHASAAAEERVVVDRLEDLHEVLLQRFRSQAFSGAVLVADGDEVVFRREYGIAEQRGTRPLTRNTRFDVGSLDKVFTSVAVLRLAQEGRLELDAPLSQYLPELAADVAGAGEATIRQLLQHRAGFGDYLGHPRFRESPEDLRTVADYLELVRSQPLMYSPGATRQYSNSGFVVLGAVIEAVTGKAYHDVVRELVFRPAGMQSTGPARDASSATGYTRADGRVAATTDRWPPVASPAGGSHATAGDLHAFVGALMSDRLLDSRWTDTLLRDFEGPGGEPIDRGGPWDMAWEGGAAGLNAHMSWDAPRRRIVVVLSNMDPPAASSVGRAILLQGR
jgi:D-alanyl-D-alanine carboxypeptidase